MWVAARGTPVAQAVGGTTCQAPLGGPRTRACATALAPEAGTAHTGKAMLTDAPNPNPIPGPGANLDAVFQALAHPVRRSILELLREGDRTVGDLAEPFHQSRPSISQHLDVLEQAGLVRRIPAGRTNLCRLTGAPMAPAADWLLAYARYWTDAFDRLERHFRDTLDAPTPGRPHPLTPTPPTEGDPP